MNKKEIAQWVIDNRYAKNESNKISDFEMYNHIIELMYKLTPIELPSDEEIIGRFMNWFLKHYSTATIDGMFGYVNSMEQEVTIREILNHYFNKEQILGKEDKTFKQKSKWTEVDNMTKQLK